MYSINSSGGKAAAQREGFAYCAAQQEREAFLITLNYFREDAFMGKTAVITGASGGFGYEFAKLLAKDGYDLVLVARSGGRLRKTAKNLRRHYGVAVHVFVKDLSERDAAKEVFSFSAEKDPSPEILINNAGFGDYGCFAEGDYEKLTRMVDLNDRTLMQLTHLFLQPMIASGKGRILNVASIASFMPGPQMALYYATKAFVLSLTEGLSEELRGTGVTVTALCPGPSDTGFVERANMPGSRFSDMFRFTKPSGVAKAGYRALMKGKTIEVPGVLNYLGSAGVRLLPRGIVRKIVYRFQK